MILAPANDPVWDLLHDNVEALPPAEPVRWISAAVYVARLRAREAGA